MKFLRVIDSMNPASGGPCQGIRNSIPVLEKVGIINEVVSSDDPESDFVKNDVFVLHAIGPASNPWSYNKRLVPWLTDNLLKFDVVIVHGLWRYHGHAVYKVFEKIRRSGKDIPKLFVMPHGMLDPYFQLAGNRKLKAIRNRLYWHMIEKKLVNRCDGLLFTCEEELRLARETFSCYYPKSEIDVGYGIIEPPAPTPKIKEELYKVCPRLINKDYFLFLSRIHEKKGIDSLIIAYSEWVKKNLVKPEIIPRLVIAGPGMDSKFGRRLLKLVKLNQISELVEFPGMLTGTAKWAAFYGAEAFFLPSHQENFGIAVVEALACGKPVLISDQVNIWREISQNGGGLVDKDTLEGVSNLLSRWGNLDTDDKIRISKCARKLYQNHYSIETASKKFVRGVLGDFVSKRQSEKRYIKLD